MPPALLATISLFASPAAAVSINWVTVGDPDNVPDSSSYGAVTYTYRISVTEVTNSHYSEFLNAVDPTGANALGLYNASMEEDPNGGIGFDVTNPVGSRYLTKLGFTNKPANYVSFYDALRFTNWLGNGQGSGDTETGGYTLLGGTATPSNGTTVTRNAGATIFLPSEDEWYKPAYYDAVSASYYEYPAGSDTQTSCGTNPLLSNSANCAGAVGAVSEVGTYTASPSPPAPSTRAGTSWSGTKPSVALASCFAANGAARSATTRCSSQRLSATPASRRLSSRAWAFASRASRSPVRACS